MLHLWTTPKAKFYQYSAFIANSLNSSKKQREKEKKKKMLKN